MLDFYFFLLNMKVINVLLIWYGLMGRGKLANREKLKVFLSLIRRCFIN